ncbi:dynein axonemal assembly factor 4-like [Uranotaenia lowii]|uniref:dynein axonemal assembly factor 4-like n=1 Tax=Uranotaenia lowii TaxID=190385 RepID=UPI002479964B|nr:dynein axonemal assembly factor 4-like [Uranotaenia lowii]
MPVLLKNHSWNQDSDHITIRVPFPENRLREDDVFTSAQLLKINKPPYYWEALLFLPIVEEDSRCSLLENEVVFILKKQKTGLDWGQLEIEATKQEKISRKEQLLEEHRKRQKELAKQRAIEKDQKKRDEVSRQIERDSEKRAEVERILEESKRRELERMNEAGKKALQRAFEKPKAQVQEPPAKPKITKPVPTSKLIEKIPDVRSNGTVQVTFTKRTFVTPKRESMEHEEKEWIMKQSAVKKAVGCVEDDDLRPEERNPEWLKQKGDSFFQQKNYLAAISAYSTGIKLTKEYYSLYLNRSAAHLAMENYQRCAEDCSAALELLVPPIEANRKARTTCLARRGAALVKMGYIRQGFEELSAACKLDPLNENLRREMDMVAELLENNDEDNDD